MDTAILNDLTRKVYVTIDEALMEMADDTISELCTSIALLTTNPEGAWWSSHVLAPLIEGSAMNELKRRAAEKKDEDNSKMYDNNGNEVPF